MRRKRLLMIGPGYGHNIIPIIEQFNRQTLFDVDFLCHSFNLPEDDYENINFIPFPKVRRSDLVSCIKYILFLLKYSIFGKRYNVLLIQGEIGIFLLFLQIFVKAKTKIFVPWSIDVYNLSQTKTLEGRIIRQIFIRSDYIQVNWFSSKEKIEKLFPNSKTLMFFWGLNDSFFIPPVNVIESDFVRNFLSGISDQKIIVFWPRSIITCHRQDLVVEALALIKKESPKILINFTLYLWPGNVEDKIFRAKIEKIILNTGIDDIVKIVDHPFVSYNDIRIIENRSNFFIQISEQDGLSTFIHEMLLQKKEIILSKTPHYKYLNDYFDLKLEFVDNDINAIAAAIKNKLALTGTNDNDILEYRKNIIINNFNFSKNYTQFIEHIHSL